MNSNIFEASKDQLCQGIPTKETRRQGDIYFTNYFTNIYFPVIFQE